MNEKSDRNFYYVLSGIIPFLVMLIAYVIIGIFPFGERAVTIIDSYHQYAPFFSEYYDKIVNGHSLWFSWNGGLGINFWSIMAYYLMSPLNIITLIFPRAFLLEGFALVLMLKVALSGCTFTFYLHKHYKKLDFTSVCFGTMYALSGWVLGYSWNIMWLDCVFMLPLVLWGLERLVKEGKGLFYGITLGLCIIFNYYISIMICIFAVIYYIALFIQRKKKNIKIFFKSFVRFAGYSLLAGGLSAVVCLPAMFTLLKTHSAESEFPTKLKFYHEIFDLIGQHLAFVKPTDLSGLPNLYCGVAMFMFVILYLFRKKTPVRYKVSKLILVAFLLLSCNLNVLDFIWHGFHYPNSLPNRFTFIYIFLLLTIGYEVVLVLRQYSMGQMFLAFISTLALIVCCYIFGEEEREIYVYIISITWVWVYFFISTFGKIFLQNKKLVVYIFCGCLLLETVANGIYGFCENGSVNRTSYNEKIKDAEEIRALIGDDGNDALARTELDQFHGRNNAMWLGFKSLSMFSSTLSDGLDTMIDQMGYFAAVNKFTYEGSTRLTDDILGIKYLVSEDQKENIRGFYLVKRVGELFLYENENALPIAFMVNDTYKNWVLDSPYPWENLNQFVEQATGIEDWLFNFEIVTWQASAQNGNVSKSDDYKWRLERQESGDTKAVFNYTAVSDQERYLYYEASRMEHLKVMIDGRERTYNDTRGHVIDLGFLNKGDEIQLTFTLEDQYDSEDIELYMFGLDENVYQNVYNQLSDEVIEITEYTDCSLKGMIEAKKDGIMFTSIPYDSGWTVYVDGEKVKTQALNDGLMYIDLPEGMHEISMVYVPTGFVAGMSISAICLLILIIMLLKSKKVTS